MAASGAKYGIATSHFYWLGAIPAMVFVGLFMMPFYYGSRAHSVPEYLRLRFDEKTRGLNAITFAVMTIFSSGISMYAMAKLIQAAARLRRAVLGSWACPRDWIFHASIIVSALIVLGYVYLGGLTSAIYNEVLQFFLIVAGFLPLVLLGLKNVGGWAGLQATAWPAWARSRSRTPGSAWSTPVHQPAGRGVVRPGDGPGLRALVRLLVHRLPGRAAGDGRRLDARRPAHAADRRRAQDVLPVPGDPARPDRHRACPPSRPTDLAPRTPPRTARRRPSRPARGSSRPRSTTGSGQAPARQHGQARCSTTTWPSRACSCTTSRPACSAWA